MSHLIAVFIDFNKLTLPFCLYSLYFTALAAPKNDTLADLLARDPRQLPIEAIEAAKKKRNPWDL